MSATIENHYSVNEAAKILGKSDATIKRMCARGELDAEKRGKRDWIIKRSSIENKIVEKSADSKPVAIQKSITESVDDEERILIESVIEDRNISRADAERIIKIEDAIKRQRDNLLREGQLVEVDKIKKALETHYVALIELWEELIDVWSVKLNLSAERSQEMLTDFKVGLRKQWRNIKSEILKS